MPSRTTTAGDRKQRIGDSPIRRNNSATQKKSPKPRPQDTLHHLMALDIKTKAGIAICRWARNHGQQHDWTYQQLAEEGGCDATTIGRAIPALLRAGLVINTQPHVLARRSDDCQTGLWIFTDVLYALVFPKKSRSHRAAKCLSPRGTESFNIEVPTSIEHEGQAPADANAAPGGASLGEGLLRTLAETVQMDLVGVRHARPDIPADLRTPDAVAVIGSVVLARASAREVRPGKTVQHVVYGILRHLDRQIIGEVRQRIAKAREAAEAASRAGADTTWALVSPSFRMIPGVKAAFDAWQRLQASAPLPTAAGYLFHHDQEREARLAVIALAEAALGARADTLRADLHRHLEALDMKDGSLVWKRAWNNRWAHLVAQAWSLPLGGA